MKRAFAAVLACVLACSLSLTGLAVSFPDMEPPQWDWARETVEQLSDQGIIKGYTDGTYKPNNQVTNEEAFTLFARSVGVDATANAEAVSYAQSRYASVAAKYDTFATKELCFMLYRGLFSESQVDTYLSAERKGQPLLRHEAAILITRLMGGEQEVQDKYMYVLDYTDTDQIPQSSKGYVEYVRDKGIMQGMDDGSFSPMTSVTRAQIAVMLQKTMQVMSLSTASGTITAVDTASGTLTVDGNLYGVGENVKMRLNGQDATLDSLSAGMSVVVTTSHGNLWAIDATSSAETPPPVDQTIEGVYVSSLTDTRGTFLKVYDLALGSTSSQEYQVSSQVTYTRGGKESSLSNLQQGDYVTLSLSGGLVVAVDAQPKTVEITGAVLQEIVVDGVPAMTIRHSNAAYNGLSLPISDDVIVRKNSQNSELRALTPGDSMNLTLEYGEVTMIEATSSSRTAEGTIEAITIGQNSHSIVVSVSGESQTYTLTRDTEIVVDNVSASIYDLRVGYHVRLNIESEAVTYIEVRAVENPTSLSGVVELVNTSLGFINLTVTDTSGTVSTQQVFVGSNTSIIESASATKRQLKDIDVGDTLMVTGTVNMGAFEASTIIIMN